MNKNLTGYPGRVCARGFSEWRDFAKQKSLGVGLATGTIGIAVAVLVDWRMNGRTFSASTWVAAVIGVICGPVIVGLFSLAFFWFRAPSSLDQERAAEIDWLQQQLADAMRAGLQPALEIRVVKTELDYISLIPAVVMEADREREEQGIDAPEEECSALWGYLGSIEIINHDNSPTEVLRIWLRLTDQETNVELVPMKELAPDEEKITPAVRVIEARRTQRYKLEFKATFRERITQRDARRSVDLCVTTTGLGTKCCKLGDEFFLSSENDTSTDLG